MSHQRRSPQLRKGRHSCPGQIYLITAATLGREPIFTDLYLGRILVREMMDVQAHHLARSLAWVVMPDHWHWLFELESGSLQGVVQRVKSRSAIAVNKARGTEGRLWQRGFHDTAIRKEQDLLCCARYVIANPVRAGLVLSVRQYSLWDAMWI